MDRVATSNLSDESTYAARTASPLTVVAGIVTLIGGLNWGLVGLANVDVVAALFGAQSPLSRILYIVVALATIWTFVASLKTRALSSNGRRVP